MDIDIDTSAVDPVYEQIVRQIHLGVQRGALAPGDALPTIRQLASDLEVNPNTVAKAYKLLEQQRIIQTGGAKGTFVHATAAANAEAHRMEQAAHRMRTVVGELTASGLTAPEIEQVFQHVMKAAAR